MKKLLILLKSFVLLNQSLVAFAQPASDFSHIEIVIDSVDFKKLVASSFVRDTLGLTSYDTMQKSPLAIGYYINGEENFINVNPNVGYFATQRGSVYLIFQSRRPGQGALLQKALASVTQDSIISYDFKAPSFTLTEIIFKNHYNLQLKKTNHLIPMLSSYSVDSYKGWGFSDSAEVDMKTFIGFDTDKHKRLFTKIESIHVSLTQEELTQLESVMQVVHYKKQGDCFTKSGQPTICFSINHSTGGYKIRELTLLLNQVIPSRTLHIGNTLFTIKDKKAIMSFN